MKAYFEIIRPFNTIFVALTILFGAFFHSHNYSIYAIIFAIFSAGFISAAGYVINDFYDIQIDKINRPDRVLPSNRMRPKVAFWYAIILLFLGIIFGFLTQKSGCIFLALLNSFLMFYYAKSLKKKFLFGNLVVAYAAGSAFIFGAISNSNLKNVFVVSIVAFLYTLVREIVKDMEDVEGDIKENSSTLPIILGKKAAAQLTIIPILIIFFFLNYKFIFHGLNIYKIVINPFNYIVTLPLLILFLLYSNNLKAKFLHKISLIMKLDMLLYLVGVWFI